MSYEFIQTALTAAIQATVVLGFTSIVAKEALRHIRKAPTAPALAVDTPDTQAIEPEVEPIAEPEAEPIAEVMASESSIEEILEGIDLDKLQLRPARKIARKIGVAQKVGGKDAPLSWLRAQIKSKANTLEAAQAIAEVLKAA